MVAVLVFVSAIAACSAGSPKSGSATRFCADERRGSSQTGPVAEVISARAIRDAPPDIRPDVETVAPWVNKLSNLASVTPSVVQAALVRVLRYVDVVCGLTPPAGFNVPGVGRS
jgi:hypothetical protein